MMRYLLLATLLIGACRNSTEYGDCIGVGDTEDPRLMYETSTRNVVLAVVFSETIVVPLVVILSNAKCPTSHRPSNVGHLPPTGNTTKP